MITTDQHHFSTLPGEPPMTQETYLIIAKAGCPWCVEAEKYLEGLGHKVIYKYVEESEDLKAIVKEDIGATTVPQIFKLVGGYSDLVGKEKVH